MKKQNFNLHTHTKRCGHASGLDIQYVNSAIEAGFEILGFSDHIPFEEIRIPGARMFYEQKEEYISSIKKLKKEFAGKIDIKIGYEVEYLEDKYAYLMEMKKECEYMILGQHLKDLTYEYDCYCSDEDVLQYAKQIESALAKNFITYVAHPDYFMLGRRTFSPACIEATHCIAKASLTYDTPLEVNLNGFRYGKNVYQVSDEPTIYQECYAYPFREFWEIIATYGCKVVYGYDAHRPVALLERDKELLANEILKDIPLQFIDTITLK